MVPLIAGLISGAAVLFVLTGPIRRPAPSFLVVDSPAAYPLAGTLQWRSPGQPGWENAAGIIRLAPGMALRTGPASHAALVYTDGSTSELEPDTEIELDRVDGDGRSMAASIVARQKRGTAWHAVWDWSNVGGPSSRLRWEVGPTFLMAGPGFYLTRGESGDGAELWAVSGEGWANGLSGERKLVTGQRLAVGPDGRAGETQLDSGATAAMLVLEEGAVAIYATDSVGRSVGYHPSVLVPVNLMPGADLVSLPGRSGHRLVLPLTGSRLWIVVTGLAQGGRFRLALRDASGQPLVPAGVLEGSIGAGERQIATVELAEGRVVQARPFQPLADYPPGFALFTSGQIKAWPAILPPSATPSPMVRPTSTPTAGPSAVPATRTPTRPPAKPTQARPAGTPSQPVVPEPTRTPAPTATATPTTSPTAPPPTATPARGGPTPTGRPVLRTPTPGATRTP